MTIEQILKIVNTPNFFQHGNKNQLQDLLKKLAPPTLNPEQ
jgi:hypothetical protein